ncbi:pre-mRNA-processing protein 40A isoform X2 [Coffea arabica]|uniref:Pre-mRNA-processing protein 40A isoform X2 n=1 Tax=Coffea arabica TaxID=13443 RepID=A0A6P6USB3_COFAR|nr:pre-mRNA-processing protein 40A-like isoform X2 [Coffea arabica]
MANNPPQSSGAQPLRPPAVGSVAPPNYGVPFPMQFRPAMPGQQGQLFPPISTAQQFRPVGQVQNVGLPHGQTQPLQYSQPMQQFPSQLGTAAPSSQPIHNPLIQQNMPITSGAQQPQQTGSTLNNHLHGVGGPAVQFSSSYTTQNGMNIPSQHQTHAPGPWLQPGSQGAPTGTHLQHTTQQPSAAISTPSNWQEFEAANGRRYYYNKVTQQSSWEKPLELMTPIERADASTVWKEFTTPEGRKYYYNKETKESKWTMPEELKRAREQAEKAASFGSHLEMGVPTAPTSTSVGQPPLVTSVSSTSSTVSAIASSPIAVTPVAAVVNSPTVAVFGSPAVPTVQPAVTSMVSVPSLGETSASPAPTTGSLGMHNVENNSSHIAEGSTGEASSQDIEEAKKGMAVAGKVNVTTSEEKPMDDEPLVFTNKQEAKNAFKALLESANVEADWTWEQAMRVIINDKRYGALKTLGERKQAFNEYLMQRKKIEAEERRLRQRKAKEEFTKMLEECRELTSLTRWSKAVTMLEDDERFKAVEKESDREDLFRSYLVDLQKKERVKAQEEHRRNRSEYRQFLETCGFIKVDSQWRKVQDLLEDDERCSRLDKIDRLEIFQEYIRDLEREEEEQKKKEKEQLRRAERKNRDAFRKLMEEHIAAGILNAKTLWRDYCQKVKDTEAYQAVALSTSGSTPMDLFEDVLEELENQYHDDKTRIKDAVKLEKISVLPMWTLEDFKAAIKESISSEVSDINLQLVFEDLLERAKEKEEKEAKKRQRLAKDFSDLLSTIKEITATSNWEESKELLEDSSEYRSIGEENSCKEIFEEYIARLQEKAKEKERKREEEKARKEREREEKEKKKDKERREKEKEKEKDKEKEREREREREKEKGKERSKKDEVDTANADVIDDHGLKEEKKKEKDDHGLKEEKKREKDRDKKHRKRHHSVTDDASSEKDEKEETKKSRRHSGDRKKSRKHGHSPESDCETRHKRHRKDHRDGSRRGGGHEELEDGELGEDVEME